jgi:hypothetical protein
MTSGPDGPQYQVLAILTDRGIKYRRPWRRDEGVPSGSEVR